jgi:tRNA-dihydrouridine synthase A
MRSSGSLSVPSPVPLTLRPLPLGAGAKGLVMPKDAAVLNTTRRGQTWPLSIAPMMDRTDQHYRYFMRQITRHTLLYTEMLTPAALLHGDRHKFLGFSAVEKPLALQVGGDDLTHLALCVRLAEDWGYDEVNLNVGCPSDRVQHGHFGACLMAQPTVVAQCVAAMRQATTLPVTVKHRIGIDDRDRYEDMAHFVHTVAQAGCDRFIVHARQAVLQGLSPRENRTVPPLRYDDVYRLKADFPALRIEINGGITTLLQATAHLRYVDGAMLGRAAYEHPYLFAEADALCFGDTTPSPTRRQVLDAMLSYLECWMAQGLPPYRMVRHLLPLFAHQRAARLWKRALSERTWAPDTAVAALREAMGLVPDDVLDAHPQTAEPAIAF